ncbi:MAG: MBL fold metallo-hydrolase [Faecalibacterium sp.]|nr:MBL fold metallo-hydrolase [Ruminococcus sp.]MCM1391654.1 MBL fold metallo-hydrolase [Ruminococcus sp.]MCM1486221.1 MBL fold metallo-hydrolase [Faecalibacterium sp.]
MASQRKRRNTKGKSTIALIVLIVALISVILGRNNESFESVNITADNNVTAATDEIVKVHFIDVGQGSSTLVQSGNTGILIDAGEREYGQKVVDYLKKSGIKRLEYVVASHPHSDHIGGLSDVLNAFHVENIIMPELIEINIPTTRIYEQLLTTIAEKDINAIAAKLGDKYTVGNATMEIIGPIEQLKDLNNMSVICKVQANAVKFMILADAEKKELETVYKHANLKSDIITMGHHGSKTSLHDEFLSRVNAKVAVISCGKDNSYGHPNEETINYLDDNNIAYYRTDKNGSIVFTCNNKGYAVDLQKGGK